MTTEMGFPATAVLQHADAVTESADDMTTARAAIGDVAMDNQAYGQLCQFLPTLLTPLFAGAGDVMNDAVEALAETALNLRTTASAITATDAGSARRLDAAAGPGLDLPL
jgi:hypothetical protein